jgi:hypothetical protein
MGSVVFASEAQVTADSKESDFFVGTNIIAFITHSRDNDQP